MKYLKGDDMRNIPFSFFDIEVCDKTAWFVSAYYPALFSYNLISKDCEMETMLPTTDGILANSYGPIIKYENLLVIVPRCLPWILLYDIDSKRSEKIEINIDLLKEKGRYNLFSSAYLHNGYVYVFPGRYPAIVKLSIQTKTIEYINDWYIEIQGKLQNENYVLFRNPVRKGNIVFLPGQSGMFMSFDMTCDKYELSYCKNEEIISAIDFVEGKMICSYRDKNFITVDDVMVSNGSDYNGVDSIVVNGNDIYVFPIVGGCVQKYNLSNREWRSIYELPNASLLNYFRYKVYDCNFLSVKKIGDRIFFSSVYDGKMIILDIQNDTTEVHELFADDRELIKSSLVNGFEMERANYTLSNYLDDLVYI